MNRFVAPLVFLLLIGLSGCGGCSKSGRRASLTTNQLEKQRDPRSSTPISPSGKSVTVKMKKQGGVYYIPVELNGVEMQFIFDTGASSISISVIEAQRLIDLNLLSEEDYVGTQQFMDATGDISVGSTIILKSVQIGSKHLRNVEATVVNSSNAPLLLGQSALERFGKISIDYSRETIRFD